jgi:hypothetical protein
LFFFIFFSERINLSGGLLVVLVLSLSVVFYYLYSNYCLGNGYSSEGIDSSAEIGSSARIDSSSENGCGSAGIAVSDSLCYLLESCL